MEKAVISYKLPPGPGFSSTSPDVSNKVTITEAATDKTESRRNLVTDNIFEATHILLITTFSQSELSTCSYVNTFHRIDRVFCQISAAYM